MDYGVIKKGLEGFDAQKVDVYIDYLKKIEADKKPDGGIKNPWFKYKTAPELIACFKKVSLDGLFFDGIHITLQSTGISYDYIAYRNLMYQIYPESIIDLGIIYSDDTFIFQKHSGKITYTHNINNPFNQNEDNMVGGYVVIKNKRGEFLTLLNKEDIKKHRKVAKTDTIWRAWPIEMAMKTLIKKATKLHFNDIYSNVETLDNEQYDLDLPLGVDIKDKQSVEGITTLEALKTYWKDNSGRNAGVKQDFDKLVSMRKKEIEEANIAAAKQIFSGEAPDTEQPHQLGD